MECDANRGGGGQGLRPDGADGADAPPEGGQAPAPRERPRASAPPLYAPRPPLYNTVSTAIAHDIYHQYTRERRHYNRLLCSASPPLELRAPALTTTFATPPFSKCIAAAFLRIRPAFIGGRA
eukprot:281295-Rhodomonas_salina.1